MKIYNQDLTMEFQQDELDFSLGYLKGCSRENIIPEQKEIQEQGHYEVIAEYENGGKDIQWVIDQKYVPACEERVEIENYQVYIPFTEAHLHNILIREQIKKFEDALAQTDFQVLKYIEGELGEEHFLRIKNSRQHCREQIRLLQKELMPGETEEEKER